MSPLSPLQDRIERLLSLSDLHHTAARLLYKIHRKPTVCLMYVVAALNRSLALIDGFSRIIPDNYICAVPLVRLQLDCALRFSALFLVADQEAFARRVCAGEQINKLEDRDGQKMQDAYLVRKLNAQYPGVNMCYEDGCGYVHFSDAHIFHIHCKTPEGKWQVQVGGDLNVTEDIREDAVFMMDQATRLLIVAVEKYIQQKDPSLEFVPAVLKGPPVQGN
jgi:hypothetical protein